MFRKINNELAENDKGWRIDESDRHQVVLAVGTRSLTLFTEHGFGKDEKFESDIYWPASPQWSDGTTLSDSEQSAVRQALEEAMNLLCPRRVFFLESQNTP